MIYRHDFWKITEQEESWLITTLFVMSGIVKLYGGLHAFFLYVPLCMLWMLGSITLSREIYRRT